MATRSAMRAGWFTGGVMLKMPEPMWMLFVLAAHEGQERLGGREVRVLGQEVVLGRPGVLEAGLVGRHDERDLVHDAVVLGRRSVLLDVPGQHARGVEDAEFHGFARPRLRCRGPFRRRS